MILIAKSPNAPAILDSKGTKAARKHCEDYDSEPVAYCQGTRTFKFRRPIYAAKAGKEALRRDQHRKCAFCESSFDHVDVGDVEHFRPKAGYKQSESDDLGRPGYFWLAYEWSNLFLSCKLCNQQFKKNLFPLKNPRRRARPSSRKIDREEPLLIDPSKVSPGDHIGFNRQYAYPGDGSTEGAATIAALGINRERLAEMRGRRIRELERLTILCQLLRDKQGSDPADDTQQLLKECEKDLTEMQEDSAEYAAMARAFLGDS